MEKRKRIAVITPDIVGYTSLTQSRQSEESGHLYRHPGTTSGIPLHPAGAICCYRFPDRGQILRVTGKDKNSRKKTEYVLIGTLLSFTTAILTGLAVNLIIH